MKSTHQEINDQVNAQKPGAILFPTDFRGLGTEGAIKKAMSRLVKDNKLERLAHGIYYIPKTHPSFGKLHPSLEEVAEAVAAHEHIRILPTGVSALNKLGLSTQVPTRQVYITDGQARQIKVGKGGIKFKPTTPKKFGMKGPISSLMIQALEELDQNQITPEMSKRIRELLDKETPENLMADIKLASARVNDILVNIYFKPQIND